MPPNDTGSGSVEANPPASKDGKEGNKKPTWAQRQAKPVVSRQAKFEGKCDDLKGHIYDCSDSRQADQFTRTTKEIGEYVGREYRYGADIRRSVEALRLYEPKEPEEFIPGGSEVKRRVWEKKIDEYVKRVGILEENINTLFSLVWGQCSDIMRQKVEALNDYATMADEADGIKLLKAIKSLTFNFQSQKWLPHSIHESSRRFCMFSQGKLSTVAYHEQFLNIVEVIGTISGNVGVHPGIEAMVAKEKGKPIAELTEEDRLEAKEMYLATAFLLGSDRGRYGKLIEDTENDFLKGRDSYPRTVSAAYNLLTNFRQDPRNLVRSVGVSNDGVAFTNVDGNEDEEGAESGDVVMNTTGSQSTKKGKKTRDKTEVKCRRCGEKGHYPSECDGVRLVRPGGTEANDASSAASSLTSASSSNTGARQSGATMLLSGVAEGEFDEDNLTTGFQFLTHHGGETVFQTSTGQDSKASSSRAVPSTWILLDNQSTVDVFHNSKLLRNIRKSDTFMDIHCNAGVTSTDMVGDLPGYGTVWYHPNGIANILSLARVKERGYSVRYDSDHGNCFIVTKPDGSIRTFKQSERGLFYMPTTNADGDDVALVNTVDDNRSRYNVRDYSRAVIARKLQAIIGRPSVRQYRQIVTRNFLPNCPINRRDIDAAEDIFGPDVGCLKGKTVRRPTPHAPTKLMPVPMKIMKQYRNITLAGDVLQVNRIPFFATVSHHIRFCTSEMITDQKTSTLLESIKQVRNFYAQRGFRIVNIVLDGQFEPMRGDLADLNIALETCGHDDHVPEIERHIRTLKERARAVCNTLPFQRLPARMIIELIHYCTFWLNAFPHVDGVSDVLSPRNIVSGLGLDFNKHCRIEYGAYAQVHQDHDNSMAPRTFGAIALRPTGNAHGSYYFYHLNTGRLLNRSRWTELPMPDDVIARVHRLSRKGRQGIEFLNRDGQPFLYPDAVDVAEDGDDNDDDDDDDDSYHPSLAGSLPDDDDDDADDIAGVFDHAGYDAADNDNIDPEHNNNEEAPNIPTQHVRELPGGEERDYDILTRQEDEAENAGMPNEADPGIAGVPIEDNVELAGVPIDNVGHGDMHNDDDGGDPVPDIAAEMEAKYGRRGDRYSLRERKPRDYSHLHITTRDIIPVKPRDYSHLHAVLEHTVMTQHSLKRGLKEFGDAGIDAVLKELKQLHDRQVIKAVNPHEMTREQKREALQYLMFLKKKRCGRIKGRGCADGRKQRLYTAKEEASSPTVAIESVILSCVIDAMEARDVATVDIPGAFMHADMDDEVFMRLEGTMAELLVRLDEQRYLQHIITENGRKVLYVKLQKALYGTLKAALLFWKHLSDKLLGWGFVKNPYDSCVVNKQINGAQCTILWHVDDLKISHVDPEVVSDVIRQLESEFGKEAPLTVNRGKTHDYLGMTIDYSTPGKVKIGMVDYIDNMLADLPEDMGGKTATPAPNHLFQVASGNARKLDADRSTMFHHNAAKLLFLCKRARPDVQTATAFLCTRVKSPDEDDYKKLTRVMQYLRGTRDMQLTLEASNVNIIKWWVDASFAVHPDMKSHTGAIMTLGRGAMYTSSTRQKLNGRSSTEGELIGVSDILPQIIWTRYFLEAQGYPVTESIIFQDNQSAMLLEKNGKASSSKRTRHINIRYFFVTDRIANKEVKIEYCPTGDMIADYFTKPLQGTPFRKFRDDIMNIDSRLVPIMNHRSVLGMESSDGSNNDSTDGWITVNGKKPRKTLINEVNDSHGHSTTRNITGVTSMNKGSEK